MRNLRYASVKSSDRENSEIRSVETSTVTAIRSQSIARQVAASYCEPVVRTLSRLRALVLSRDRSVLEVAVDRVDLSQWEPTGESGKSFAERVRNGFVARYLSGPIVLDIGYRGGAEGQARTVVPHATGVDLDYPGYDGRTLPWPDASVDAVYSSHVLEHIDDPGGALRDWFRVLKLGGYVVCHVPHQFLYEKKAFPPSRFNLDHRRFYTPARLLREIEEALAPNTYRLRHLADFDESHDYTAPPDVHACWGYEIHCVLQKITPPTWDLT